MDYLNRLKIELSMAHMNDGWYNNWLRQTISSIEIINGNYEKSKENS